MASVTYRIGGRYDGKAVKQAQSGFSSLKGTVASLKGVLSALGVVAVLKKVTDYSKQCTEAFSIQQKAISQLGVAVSNNKNLTQQSLKSIIDFTGKLQSQSIYGDETLQRQATYLAGLGLEEDQLKKVLEASVELSSAGVGSLESNVQNLAKTLNGTSGRLGQMVPEMQELTKAQLENGEAIDIVLKKYKGFANNLATNTLEGATKQVGNLVGDIKEKLGSISGTLKFNAFQKLIPILENINQWLSDNINKITNVFLNLPEIGGKAFQMLKGIAHKLFTIEGFTEYFKIVGKLMLTIMKNSLLVLFNLVMAIGETIWEPLKVGFEWIGYGIKLAFATVVNFFIDKINKLVDGFVEKLNWLLAKINVIRNFFGQDDIALLQGAVQIQVKTVPDKPTDKVNTKAINDAWKTVGESLSNGIKDIVNGYKETGEELGQLFGDEIGEFKNGVIDVMNRPIEIMGMGSLDGSTTEVAPVDTSPVENATKGLKEFMDVLNILGELGQAVAMIMSSNIIGLILEIIAKLVSALGNVKDEEGNLTEASETWNKFINCISETMAVVAEMIAPFMAQIVEPIVAIIEPLGHILGELLAPALNAIGEMMIPITDLLIVLMSIMEPIANIIGTILGLVIALDPVLNLLTAVIKIFADAIKFVYNKILVPVVNFLLQMISRVGNFFIKMYNGVVGVLNGISIFGYHPFNFSQKSMIDYDSIKLSEIGDTSQSGSTTSSSVSSTSGSGKGSSYTAAKDVYVSIYFTNSYVNGDARAIALSLRDEIKSAEALGY